MSALRTATPQHLRTFVEPQIEQLSFQEKSVAAVCTRRFRNRSAKGFSGRRRSARSASSVCT